eukprot:COSAG02_NODE_913_length_15994_cov_6.140484_3_plen_80_part_00
MEAASLLQEQAAPCRNSGSLEGAVAPPLIQVVQTLLSVYLSWAVLLVEYTQVAALALAPAPAPALGLARLSDPVRMALT